VETSCASPVVEGIRKRKEYTINKCNVAGGYGAFEILYSLYIDLRHCY
jgi:hypothetical protein